MDTDYDYISDILPMLFAAKTLEDAGRTDILCDVDDALDPDNCYTFSLEALEHVCDFVTGNYNEERELSSYYFSDESIMEYYRLCRKYSKQKGVSLKENPFMQRAKQEVDDFLSSGCYYCYYVLKTKINHKWASGIVFYYDSNFFEFDALLERMIEIIDFFRCEVRAVPAEDSLSSCISRYSLLDNQISCRETGDEFCNTDGAKEEADTVRRVA